MFGDRKVYCVVFCRECWVGLPPSLVSQHTARIHNAPTEIASDADQWDHTCSGDDDTFWFPYNRPTFFPDYIVRAVERHLQDSGTQCTYCSCSARQTTSTRLHGSGENVQPVLHTLYELWVGARKFTYGEHAEEDISGDSTFKVAVQPSRGVLAHLRPLHEDYDESGDDPDMPELLGDGELIEASEVEAIHARFVASRQNVSSIGMSLIIFYLYSALSLGCFVTWLDIKTI